MNVVRKRPDRRRVLAAAAAMLLTPLGTRAQRAGRVRRIAFVSPTVPGPRNDAFLDGLRELGYVDGRNVVVEMRFAHGHPERLPALIAELLRQDVDVLVVGATIGARAAKSATTTIPVVFAGSSDPVAGGVVANLARPEANLTGFSLAIADGFAGKWLELLKEASPGVTRCATLWSSSNPSATRYVTELEAAARRLDVELQAHDAANAAELGRAMAVIGSGAVDGLIVTPSPFFASARDWIVGFAASRRLPAVYFDEDFAEAGGLLSYGPSIIDAYRKAAMHVDKILKGARPRDLPVEQPTRYALLVNLKTARALRLAVPRSLLLRADRVIE